MLETSMGSYWTIHYVADQKRKNPLSTKEIWDHLGSEYMEFYTNASMSIDLRKLNSNKKKEHKVLL